MFVKLAKEEKITREEEIIRERKREKEGKREREKENEMKSGKHTNRPTRRGGIVVIPRNNAARRVKHPWEMRLRRTDDVC